MYNPSAERSAGWSGLAFLAVTILGTIVMAGGAQPPAVTAGANAINAFVGAHARGILGWAWLGFPETAFFLWFAAGLRASLRQAAGSPDGLPLYAITAAIVAATISLMSNAVMAALALAPAGADDVGTFWATAWVLMGPILSMGTAIFVFACAHSVRRHGSAPAWLAYYGYLTALGSALGSLSLFYTSGSLGPSGAATIVLGPALFGIWIIIVSIRLIRTPAVV
ncbi:MAG TPA: hypothetical protein VFO29_05975 [Candidatus Rubrimentiphilum sp.]|nr:hypothetical protein [Candidatus Rubrimentiphilum sp.]